MRFLRVRVTPRASKNEIIRYEDGLLHVRLSAPPVDGAANSACCELVARLLRVPKSGVSVVKGQKLREKTLAVEGFTGPWPWEEPRTPA